MSYFQKDSPGKDKKPNWLPSPDGDFGLFMRLYRPDEKVPSILDGSWMPPQVRAVTWRHCRVAQRDDIFLAVLRPIARQRDRAGLGVDLGPTQAADLLAAAPGQEEKPQDVAVVALPGGPPHSDDLRVESSTTLTVGTATNRLPSLVSIAFDTFAAKALIAPMRAAIAAGRRNYACVIVCESSTQPRSSVRTGTFGSNYPSAVAPLPRAAWAAARRAIGTRNGEHDT